MGCSPIFFCAKEESGAKLPQPRHDVDIHL